MNVFTAYKTAYLAAALAGVCAWILLGSVVLPRRLLLVYSFLLVFYFAWGWVKLADCVVWAATPFYILCLIGIINEQETRPGQIAAVLALSAVLAVFWKGSLYVGFAAAASMLLLGKSRVAQRFMTASWLLIGSLAIVRITDMAVKAYAGPGNSGLGMHLGFYLFEIPLSHYLPMVKSLFAEGLGAWIIVKCNLYHYHAAPGMLARLAIMGIPAVVICLAVFMAAKHRRDDEKVWRYAIVVLAHFMILSAMLIAWSALFSDGITPHDQVNGVIQSDRYLYHLVPGLAVFWIFCIYRMITPGDGVSGGKAMRLVVILSAALLLPCIAGYRVYEQYVQPPRPVDEAAAAVHRDLEQSRPEKYKVYDIVPKVHVLLGQGAAYKKFYTPEELQRTRNSSPVRIYVVVRSDMQRMPHRPDPDYTASLAMNMVRALQLKKIGEWYGGQVQLFGGDVPPYDANTLQQFIDSTE